MKRPSHWIIRTIQHPTFVKYSHTSFRSCHSSNIENNNHHKWELPLDAAMSQPTGWRKLILTSAFPLRCLTAVSTASTVRGTGGHWPFPFFLLALRVSCRVAAAAQAKPANTIGATCSTRLLERERPLLDLLRTWLKIAVAVAVAMPASAMRQLRCPGAWYLLLLRLRALLSL